MKKVLQSREVVAWLKFSSTSTTTRTVSSGLLERRRIPSASNSFSSSTSGLSRLQSCLVDGTIVMQRKIFLVLITHFLQNYVVNFFVIGSEQRKKRVVRLTSPLARGLTSIPVPYCLFFMRSLIGYI
jgi:hypothetical protein